MYLAEGRKSKSRLVCALLNFAGTKEVVFQVLKIDGGKISLSMKEVDQTTGEDLNPQEAPLAPDAVGVSDLRNPEAPWANPETSGGASAVAPTTRYSLIDEPSRVQVTSVVNLPFLRLQREKSCSDVNPRTMGVAANGWSWSGFELGSP